MNKIKILAFYLPQFHRFQENDEWWGKGYTEWTSVGKAKPLFKGHNQPRVPTELGYYNLRMPEVREEQAQLAKEAGVEGFCYWHYWFGNGKRLLEDIFNEVLASGKPDFPFCLGWANHSWYAKNWNSAGSISQKILMEQTYPGFEDARMHFEFLLKAFEDERYVKIEGKPFFLIYDPSSLPDDYIIRFKQWTKEAGFPGLYLVANILSKKDTREKLISRGFDAVTYQRISLHAYLASQKTLNKFGIWGNRLSGVIKKIKGFVIHRPPMMVDYAKTYKFLINEEDYREDVIPELMPQWDHTPRSGWNGNLFINSTPKFFKMHAKQVFDIVKQKDNKLVLLKSWNEWGEGNYMEPDITNGRGYINALREAMDEQL